MACENPVFRFRDAVAGSISLQETVLKNAKNTNFLELAQACNHVCTIQDLKEAISEPKKSKGILPLADGTLPVGEGTWPLGEGTLPLGEGTWPLGDGTLPVEI